MSNLLVIVVEVVPLIWGCEALDDLGPFGIDTIVHGDCLDVMADLPDECVDLIVTDPPFHVTFSHRSKITPTYDALRQFDWQAEFEWVTAATRVLKEGGCLYVFTNDDDITTLKKSLTHAGLCIHQRLHWIKTNPLPSYSKRNYRGGVELAFFCSKRKNHTYFAERTQQELLGYWFLPIVGGKERTSHPTQKPIKLMEEWIYNSCPPGGIVFDPFVGSGTTCVAAKRLDRHYLGCDISEAYVEMSLKRLAAVQMRLIPYY